MVFQAAHFNPMSGHLGYDKTLNRVMVRFYWPGLRADVRRWCAACPDCKLVNPAATPKAPLHPLPLMEVPFGMDLIGPFHPSTRGYRFVLVLVDYATRYPEAVPLRSISAKSVAQALFQVISRVGIPKEILTGQGTSFMSRTIKELYGLLGIKAIRTSVYHPQTDGLVERLNKTLKTMIRKFMHEEKQNWDKWLDPLMFAMREVPQASVGFAPFELLYGRRPHGVLDVIKESWEEGPSSSKNEIQYVMDMRAKLHKVGHLSRENLLRAQERQRRTYNRGTQLRKFTPGEKVLVLLPTSSSKLHAKWQGPFEVTRQVGDVDYEVRRSDRRGDTQIYHLNLLKAALPLSMVTVVKEEEELGPEIPRSGPAPQLSCDDQLTLAQRAEVAELQRRYSDVFSSRPGRTVVIRHHIETSPGVTVRSLPYRLPEHKRKVVREELKTMLELGVIEESHSAWCSPVVLVGKKDGTVRFCVDYRRVNEMSRFDAYPMPRVDELLDRLGTARFFTTLDLTKGYWQIPLSPESREKTAFSTPEGDHRAELKRILSWPGRGTSSARLHQLWDDLEKEDVLTPTERGEILKNPTRETILRSLIDLVVQKSQEATRKMLLFLRLRDPKFEETIGDHRAEILHMKSRIVSDVSSSVLRQLLNDLVKENVLIPIEAEEITKNPDHRESARSLMNLFLQKGQEASRKMLLFLKLRDPRFDDNWCDHQAKFRYIQRSRISFYGLHQLLSYLEKEDVLTPTEREEISKNPTCETILRSLFELLVEKSEEASRKMLLFLELRNPELEENNDPENDDLHMRYWFESDLSPSVPRQLLDDLVKENVLSPIEAEEISKNPDHRESAQSLMNLVLQKGQEASRKMLLLVKLRDPRHHRICDNSMKPNWGMSSGSSGTWKMDMEPSATGHRAKTRFEAERLTGSTTLTEDEWTMLEPIVSHLDGPWYRNVEPSATGHSEKTKFEQAERLTGSTTLTEDEWTMLEPLVSHLDGPWYSFQCGPGKFECSLSSLRWICTDTMSFKYRFEPWWEHKDKLEAMQYIAGGPLLDISVDEGQFDDVYLPHWICTAANPSLLEHFAVLRVDDDGYIVEEVSEVTSSHVRLPHPIFSVKGVIIRFSRLLGISLPMKCKVLIYKTTKTFLTLHVHVILCDPALEKELDKETYVKIEKSHLEEPMKLDEQFSLKADVDSAEIYPPKLRLKHESDPNFFEVYVKSPGSEFTLMLESAVGEVWRCKIRQNDYQNATPIGSDCVQVLLRVRGEFVKRISEEVMYQLLDDLLGNGDLNDGEKDAIIQKSPICAGKVRELIDSVRRKGEATSRNMIVYLQRRDLTLHTELGLPVLE
ncbi:uncharacterized protein LOC133646933 isoform X2 [Entelurus aequoreus]|uniref:uncharacterized protein LOC133646933 isoform X2 n=1 Tax=Entelurus aequoreus TaxID=161455 RepID=UPI002B1E61A9|nr:uncharacterized protein LOC133646933 isoform X2 [Entelurus aequoreus]